MASFDVVDLLFLYIKKEEAAEFTDMEIITGHRGSAPFHEGGRKQKEYG